MRTFITCSLLAVLVAATSWSPSARTLAGEAGTGATFSSIGPLTFAPDGTLFAADAVGAAILALDLGKQTAPRGTGDAANLDQTIAAMLGTDRAQVLITDMAVHPTSKNTFVSVMRGEGAAAQTLAGRWRRTWRRSRPRRPASEPRATTRWRPRERPAGNR